MQTTDESQLDLSPFSKWFKIFGVVFILGGIAALVVPAVAGIAIELLLGWLFFVVGCAQLAAALSARKHKSFWFKSVWALLFVLVGLWLLLRPTEGVQALALIVGALFLVEAIVKMAFSWQRRNTPNIGLILVSGILSFIIAMILSSGWPQQSATILGILVGVNLLANGIVVLLLGFKMNTVENAWHRQNESKSVSSPEKNRDGK
jgi:uncharacterized membrane protein HdeD (DUF308 family)